MCCKGVLSYYSRYLEVKLKKSVNDVVKHFDQNCIFLPFANKEKAHIKYI